MPKFLMPCYIILPHATLWNNGFNKNNFQDLANILISFIRQINFINLLLKGEVTVVMLFPKCLVLNAYALELTSINQLVAACLFCSSFFFSLLHVQFKKARMSHHGLQCNWGWRGVALRACQSRRSNSPSCHRHRWRRLLLKKLYHHPKHPIQERDHAQGQRWGGTQEDVSLLLSLH